MVGNAVPPRLATVLAERIYEDLKKIKRNTK
jgi:site-specific DNA-cytosine methylase